MDLQVAYSTNYQNRRINIKQKQNSSSSLGLRRWEDLSFDLLKQLFKSVEISHLSQNVSSVCHSWRSGCWHVLFWANNELDLSVTKPVLDAVKSTAAKPLNAIVVPCSGNKYVQAMVEIKLMELLKSISEDNDEFGISLAAWRSSIRTVLNPKSIQISDKHFVYIAKRTSGLEKLDSFKDHN
ncbi:hypothetical protein Dsin_022645 [Dipteronia sinensis]|uniref:F-box domain-containing protein n=1 Tax=Dipteronia sinensis TaxID=43782 RepID=A0AAE0A1X0_9ROSI|nr:hypothetical protein Dsin_022645 [Dipteronia sinensis]